MPVICEVLVCERERHNIHDPFAVAVYKGSIATVVGHVPQRIAAMCLEKWVLYYVQGYGA